MKKFFFVLGGILMLLVGCNNNSNKVTITTDLKSYYQSMSSVKGITMIPKYESTGDYQESVTYHWQTTEGEFIESGKEVSNKVESAVIWRPTENSKPADESFDIKLEVIGCESQKVLATTQLKITHVQDTYNVK